ncbi:uncharacterized protein LOC130704256 [Daphnia carinata]|uniref:uncharacterized protein LOC130704256 n=1 Tax=Daphnia carinata TaxID=120202 RepID=UPI00257A8048|nr:uncharacterized protein LOC130704256 [Daphnia carinata]
MKIAILLVLLGLAKAQIQLGSQKRDALFWNAYPNYPVLQRVTRAQPAIYPPGKTWPDHYERPYSPQPYSFAYDVNDGYNNYGHQQQSDGYVTSGSYRVLLPDGRTQIVQFRADKNGYVADVKYEVSLFKPASPSYRPPVAPVYKTNAGQGNKAAWTAFTAYQPATKKPSYKADLIAALGYKTKAAMPSIAAGQQAAIDPQYKRPAAVPEYHNREHKTASVASAPVYRDANVPAYSRPVVVTVPEYRPPAPAAPTVQVYRVPADREKKAPTAYKIPAKPSVPVYRPAAAPEYKTAATPVYKVPETPSATYRPPPTTPAYKPREAYTTSPSIQAPPVYESSTPAPRPTWTALRYAVPETSTASSHEAPYNAPATTEYPVAVTTPAYRPPAPVYEVTTVLAELSTTPSYQNYAAPWTAFRATEAPYQPPVVPSYVPSTTVNSVRPSYETSTQTYSNEAGPTPPDVPAVYPNPELSSTYEPSAWTERPSVYVPAEETYTTPKPEINDVTTTVTPVPAVYEAPTTDATRSPWAGFRLTPEVPLYVAPTTYRPLNPPVYKVPDVRVYEQKTSPSGPAWNAWTAFRSAPARPSAGRPSYEVSTTPAYKLPPPLIYRNRKA